MSHFLQEIHKQLFSARDTYAWHMWTYAGLVYEFLCVCCINTGLQAVLYSSNLILSSLLFKLLVQELAKKTLFLMMMDYLMWSHILKVILHPKLIVVLLKSHPL